LKVVALARANIEVFDWNFVTSQRRPLSHLASRLFSQNIGRVEIGTLFANTIIAGRVEAQFSQGQWRYLIFTASRGACALFSWTGPDLDSNYGKGLDG